MVRKSLFFSFAESYVVLVLQFASTVIIARLLTPSELGIFSVAVVLTALVSVTRDFGVSEYIIQEKELTRDRIRSAFAVSLLVSWGLAGLTLLISFPAAAFYREPGVHEIMMVQACNYLLIPFGAITSAYLRREMNFSALFVIGGSGAAVAAATAIILAFKGHGYMSMAWSTLAGALTTVAVTNLYRPAGWPWLPRFKELRRVWFFGAYVSGIYVIGQAGKSAPELIIGRAVNMYSVGMFGRATSLLELFYRGVLRAVNPLVLPYFSRKQHRGENIQSGFVKAVGYLTCIGWPFFAFLAVMAYPSVRLVYGEQWNDAVPLLQILCLAGALEVIFYFSKEALIAIGQVKKSTKIQFLTQILKIAAVLAAAPLGLTAVAAALVIASLLGMAVNYFMSRQELIARNSALLRVCCQSLVVTAVTVAPAVVITWLTAIGPHNYIMPLLISAVTGAFAWVAAVFAVGHPLRSELAFIWRKVLRLPESEASPARGVTLTSRRRDARLSTLIYHRVLSRRDPLFPLQVDAAAFDRQVCMLSRYFNVLPLGEAVERLRYGDLPPRAVCITFDDGYRDNAEIALPILKKYRVSAAFFVASDYLDGGRMWNDTVIESLRAVRGQELDLTAAGLGRLSLAGAEQKRIAILRLLDHLKYLPFDERASQAERIREIVGAELPDDLMMASDQVRLLHREGMEIGGHTASHPILTCAVPDMARADIARGKERLEAIIGAPVTLFAYPNGKPTLNYKAEHVQMVKELGFSAAVCTSVGVATAASDLYQLPRFTPWDRSAPAFGWRLMLNRMRTTTEAV